MAPNGSHILYITCLNIKWGSLWCLSPTLMKQQSWELVPVLQIPGCVPPTMTAPRDAFLTVAITTKANRVSWLPPAPRQLSSPISPQICSGRLSIHIKWIMEARQTIVRLLSCHLFQRETKEQMGGSTTCPILVMLLQTRQIVGKSVNKKPYGSPPRRELMSKQNSGFMFFAQA